MEKARAAWWWIDRWRKSTAYTDMTLEEQGAYRNLLDELWLRGGVIPDSDRILAKACGDALAWPRIREAILSRFTLTPDGWRHSTHDEVANGYAGTQSYRARCRLRKAVRGSDGRFVSQSEPHRPVTVTRNLRHRQNIDEIELFVQPHQPPNPSPITVKKKEKNIHVEQPRSRGDPGGDPAAPERMARPVSLVHEVFDFWSWICEKPRAKLTRDRARKIQARLSEGYDVATLQKAILGCSQTPFNRGENVNGVEYLGLDLICRNGEKVETYAARCKEAMYDQAIRQWHTERKAGGGDVLSRGVS